MTKSIWDGLQQPVRRKPGRPPKPVGEVAPVKPPTPPKPKPPKPVAERALAFKRADPAELAAFDPSTRRCTMNCGPHRDDPREAPERMLLCGDCLHVPRDVDRR